MKRRIISLFLTLVMVLSIMPAAINAAVADPIIPLWDNVNTFNATLTFNSTTGNVKVNVIGQSGVSNITAEIRLYYKNTAGSWIEINKDWDYSVNQRYLIVSESFTGVAGREYKIEVSGTVTKNGYAEAISDTATATCPNSP